MNTNEPKTQLEKALGEPIIREKALYINVEMQKHGYDFTGERSTCYMSDLVMRQYNKVKSEKGKSFTFKDMKPVINLIATYPEFEEYYHDIALFRTKPEELINMYSEVLAQIDRNTERLMVDEMKQEVEELKQEAEELKRESEELKLEAEELKLEAEELKRESEELKLEAEGLKQETEELKQETEELKRENEELKKKHIMEYKDNARKLFVNGTSYETVRDSFDKEFLTDEDLKQIYDEVKAY